MNDSLNRFLEKHLSMIPTKTTTRTKNTSHKEASILPEFRISEHMDYYVAEQNGNFRADNKKFLTILGADVSSSAESRASVTFDGEFESDYLSTGEVDN